MNLEKSSKKGVQIGVFWFWLQRNPPVFATHLLRSTIDGFPGRCYWWTCAGNGMFTSWDHELISLRTPGQVVTRRLHVASQILWLPVEGPYPCGPCIPWILGKESAVFQQPRSQESCPVSTGSLPSCWGTKGVPAYPTQNDHFYMDNEWQWWWTVGFGGYLGTTFSDNLTWLWQAVKAEEINL